MRKLLPLPAQLRQLIVDRCRAAHRFCWRVRFVLHGCSWTTDHEVRLGLWWLWSADGYDTSYLDLEMTARDAAYQAFYGLYC